MEPSSEIEVLAAQENFSDASVKKQETRDEMLSRHRYHSYDIVPVSICIFQDGV